jgi:hypothetical protein
MYAGGVSWRTGGSSIAAGVVSDVHAGAVSWVEAGASQVAAGGS